MRPLKSPTPATLEPIKSGTLPRRFLGTTSNPIPMDLAGLDENQISAWRDAPSDGQAKQPSSWKAATPGSTGVYDGKEVNVTGFMSEVIPRTPKVRTSEKMRTPKKMPTPENLTQSASTAEIVSPSEVALNPLNAPVSSSSIREQLEARQRRNGQSLFPRSTITRVTKTLARNNAENTSSAKCSCIVS